MFLPSGFPDPSISCHFGSRVRLPATTGIVWLAFWATIFFCGVRCLQADRRPLSGFSVSLPSGRRWTRLAEGRAVPFMTGRCRYLPILPLALSGLLLIWIGGDCNRVKRQRGRSPSRHRRCRKARAKARGRLRRGRRLPADLALLQVHHGSMPPTPKPANAKEQKGSGKNKTKTEKAQVSTVEYGLPATMVVALQSISSRATQDLWGSAAFAADDLTAEQLAQRRTNAMSKHSKRLVGNVRAKADLTSSLGTWFARLSQHMVGLVGRIRAISQKVDEDLMAAVEEMQQHLATQPSTATSEQIAQAMHSLGPVWSQLQEQEVIRLAASVRAFGAVAAPSSSSGPHSFVNASPVTVSPHLAPDNSSEVSFGDATGSIRAPPLAFTDPVTPTPGSRWQKRRALATSGRPSKSPRRELGDPPVPWKAEATGRTPESQRRTSQTQIDSGPELIPAQEATTAQTHGQSWFGHWLVLVEFLVNNGGEEIGELTSDPEQEAILPLTATGADDSAVGHLAQADLGRLACGHGTSLHYSHASAMQCSPGLAVATSLRLHDSTARKTRRGSGSPAGVRECTRPVQFCTSHSTGMAASGDTCGTRRAIQRLPTTSNVCYPRSNRVIKPPVPLSPSSRGVARNDRGGRQLVKTPLQGGLLLSGSRHPGVPHLWHLRSGRGFVFDPQCGC